MSDLLFEEVNGGPVARLPHRADGSPRIADGVRVFNLAQAAARWRWSEGALRDFYASTFEDVAGIVGRAELDPQLAPGDSPGVKCDPAPPATELSPTDSQEAAAAHESLAGAVREDLLRLGFRHLSDVQFEQYLAVCRERGANPWLKQIIPEIQGGQDDQLVFITTIEHLRSIASRHADYAGQLGPEWCGEDGVWRDVWLPPPGGKGTFPTAARVAVRRRGFEDPLWGVVYWDESAYSPGGELLEHYERMPAYMLGVRAEASAIRRAYSQTSKLFLTEEAATIPPTDKNQHPGSSLPGSPKGGKEGIRYEESYDQLPPEEAEERWRRGGHQRRPVALRR